MPYDPHDVEWSRDRVGNLWRYYGSTTLREDDYFSKQSGRAVLREIDRYLDLAALGRVLDFGCGQGHMIRHLLDRGVPCLGLEFSADSAQAAQRNVGDHPLFGGVVQIRGLPSDLDEASMGAVLLVEVFEHVLEPDLAPTLAEVRRLLRPSGIVVVTTPHAEDLSAQTVHCPECGCTFHRWQHVRSVRAPDVSASMHAAGFEQVVCKPTFFRPHASWAGRVLMGFNRAWARLRDPQSAWPHLLYIGRKPRPVGNRR